MTGLKNIDCVLKDELEIYLDTKSTPESDVLAIYELEYSAQDKAGKKNPANRTLHIGACSNSNIIDFCVCLWLEIVDELLASRCLESISRLFYVCAVYAPSPEITVKGGEHVRNFQGVPYNDIGADATVTFPDGISQVVPVATVSNTVPPGCDTVGQYEVEYEAFAPGCKCCGCEALASVPAGKHVRATRIVEIGLHVPTCTFS